MQDRLSAWVARLGAPAFRRVWRINRALDARLTPAGWLLLTLLVAAAVFGLNTRDSLLYQLFAFAACLLAVASIAAGRRPARWVARRRLPPVATTGMPFEYTVSLTLHGTRPAAGLQLEDLFAVPRADGRRFARYKVAADRERNIFDRLVGYPRYVSFMRERIGAWVLPSPLPPLAPGTPQEVRLQCTPSRRGLLQFEALRCSRAEPLGLLRALARQPLADTLVVLPRTYPVAPLDLPGSRRLQPGGVSFAGHVGDAEEFVGLRDYRPGDGPRRIHWKAWARTGRPVVKEYQEEFFVRHALVLDTFGDAGPDAFEAAVSLAASLVQQPRANDSLLDLVFVEDRAYTFTLGRGLGSPPELLRVLATVEAAQSGGFETLAESVLLGAGRMSGAICVLLAWDEPRRALVGALHAQGVPVRVWLVTHDASVSPGIGIDPRQFRLVPPHRLAEVLAQP